RHVEAVEGIAGREHAALHRAAAEIAEIEIDARAGARHATDREVALRRGPSILQWHGRAQPPPGVHLMDRDVRCFAIERDIALMHGVERSARREVAAIACPIDARDHRADLSEQIIDVAIGARGRAHHGDLARELVGAAETIDLAYIGTAEDVEERAIALF